MKKKLSAISLSILILFTNSSFISNAVHKDDATSKDIKVRLDGKTIQMNTNPRIINNKTMIPLRSIVEELGLEVEWNDSTKTVIATRDNLEIRLPIGSNQAYVNGNAVNLDTPATVIKDTTFVPVRFISESLGNKVIWNKYDNIVDILDNHDDVFDRNYSTDLPIKPIGKYGDWIYYYEGNNAIGQITRCKLNGSNEEVLAA